MRIKSLNSQALLETSCFFAFSGLILYLLVTGKYLTYVTPRTKPYLYFSAVVMMVWAISNMGKIRRPQHITRVMHCLVFAVPMILILLPHSPLDASSVLTAYAGGGSVPGMTSTSDDPQGAIDNYGEEEAQSVLPVATDLPGIDAAKKRIDIPNDLFYEWLSELFTNTDAYEGYTVSMTGYVLKDPVYFGENEFVPARLAMTCCVADLVPVGMICVYDNLEALQEESWVTVEGILFKGTYLGEIEPQLSVTRVDPASALEGYVYAY